MKTSLRMVRLTLIAWLGMASAIGDLSGLVLCLGEDGHVEMESAFENQCSPAHSSHEDGVPAMAPSAMEHCGECTDYSLSLDSGIPQASARFAVPGLSLAWMAPVALQAILPAAAAPLPHRPAPLPSAALAAVRTVRLLV